MHTAGDVLHADLPAAVRCSTGAGDVAAQSQQDTAAQLGRDPRGGQISSPGLRRGTKVKAYADGHRDDPMLLVQLDPLPAGRRHGSDTYPGTVGADRREVAVIASSDKGLTDGGIDVAVGLGCRTKRRAERAGQQPADRCGPAVGCVQRANLRVGTEPAAGQVQRGEVVLEVAPRRPQSRSVGDDDPREHADGGPLGRRGRVGRGRAGVWHHDPPEVACDVLPLPLVTDEDVVVVDFFAEVVALDAEGLGVGSGVVDEVPEDEVPEDEVPDEVLLVVEVDELVTVVATAAALTPVATTVPTVRAVVSVESRRSPAVRVAGVVAGEWPVRYRCRVMRSGCPRLLRGSWEGSARLLCVSPS